MPIPVRNVFYSNIIYELRMKLTQVCFATNIIETNLTVIYMKKKNSPNKRHSTHESVKTISVYVFIGVHLVFCTCLLYSLLLDFVWLYHFSIPKVVSSCIVFTSAIQNVVTSSNDIDLIALGLLQPISGYRFKYFSAQFF